MIRRVTTVSTETAPATEPPHHEATFRQKAAWALYDWANSGYVLVVVGPVFSPFFLNVLLPTLPNAEKRGLVLAGLQVPGTTVMAVLTSLSMLLMAIGAPVFGAVADIKGSTKRLLITFATAGAILTMAMAILRPGQWVLGAALYVLSNFCFGTSLGFANAYLPRLTRPEKQGSLSGWGFALGYIGGALALIIVLIMVTKWPNDPRVIAWGLALSGVWWLVFSLPAFILLDEFPSAVPREEDLGVPLLLAGFRRVKNTFVHLRRYRTLFLFLLAFLLYNDGVETVIAMAGSFGTVYLKMSNDKLIVMFLMIQFVAFIGALIFGYVSDRIGNKMVIMINLVVWVIASILAMLTRPEPLFTAFGITFDGTAQFMSLGVLIGLVLGGVQAASRSLMGSLTPKEIHNEAFGFFSMSGKFASIFGPLLWGGFVFATGNERWGVLSIPPFLIGGLIVLMMVREPRSNPSKVPKTTPV